MIVLATYSPEGKLDEDILSYAFWYIL